MKSKLLSELNDEELGTYHASTLYQDFVLSTFQYSDLSLNYYSEYYNNDYLNLSIVVFDDSNTPVIVFYAYSKVPVLSHFGTPISVIEKPFDDAIKRDAAYKHLISKLKDIVKERVISEMLFYNNQFINAEFFSKIKDTHLEYCGYVDLTLPNEILKSNIRKSYKSLVNWGDKNLRKELINQQNIDYNKFNEFKNFHIAVSKRQTRSDKSWDMQFSSVKSGEGFLSLGYLGNDLVSGSMILYGKHEAYYSVGVYDRELMEKNLPLAHNNIITSIYESKKVGKSIFNIGYVSNNSQDEKEKNIFKFKTGFTNILETKVILHFSLNQ